MSLASDRSRPKPNVWPYRSAVTVRVALTVLNPAAVVRRAPAVAALAAVAVGGSTEAFVGVLEAHVGVGDVAVRARRAADCRACLEIQSESDTLLRLSRTKPEEDEGALTSIALPLVACWPESTSDGPSRSREEVSDRI